MFCASLADVFDNEVPAEWRADLFELIERTPHLDWLLVTKRIGNVRQMIPDRWSVCMPPNLWLGITVVNQAEADRDIPKLLGLKVSVRFLSMEPLLGPVDLVPYMGFRAIKCGCGFKRDEHFLVGATPKFEKCLECGKRTASFPALDWVIVGGESGPKARPMHPQWARVLRDQCEEAGVPFLFKQHGEFADMQTARIVQSGPVMDSKGNVADWMRQAVKFSDGRSAVVRAHTFDGHSTNLMYRVGKKAAGRLLDGVLHDGYPTPQ